MSDRPKLEPARPDAEESEGRPSWAPKLPWVWIILAVAAIAGIFTFYNSRQDARREALREQMLTLHETELTELQEQYLGFRRRIETLIEHAAEGGEPENWADPRLNISGLRGGEGLYLRMTADWATDPERIEGAALAMGADAITRCLGVAPMSGRGLYEKGFFLTPEWVDRIRDEEDMMRLRVLDRQLGTHIQVDAPAVLTMMRADWFMLVLQQGENRRDAPVDVFLWDLRRDRQLLRARIQARGVLMPVRLRFEGTTSARPAGRPEVRSGAAHDCSIASQIRALTGGEALAIETSAEVLEEAVADLNDETRASLEALAAQPFEGGVDAETALSAIASAGSGCAVIEGFGEGLARGALMLRDDDGARACLTAVRRRSPACVTLADVPELEWAWEAGDTRAGLDSEGAVVLADGERAQRCASSAADPELSVSRLALGDEGSLAIRITVSGSTRVLLFERQLRDPPRFIGEMIERSLGSAHPLLGPFGGAELSVVAGDLSVGDRLVHLDHGVLGPPE